MLPNLPFLTFEMLCDQRKWNVNFNLLAILKSRVLYFKLAKIHFAYMTRILEFTYISVRNEMVYYASDVS